MGDNAGVPEGGHGEHQAEPQTCNFKNNNSSSNAVKQEQPVHFFIFIRTEYVCTAVSYERIYTTNNLLLRK